MSNDHINKSRIFTAVMLISSSVLMLEVGLTRIFSVLFDYHYTFLAVSMALLGLGLGGVFFQIKLDAKPYMHTFLNLTGVLFGMTLMIFVFSITAVSSLANFYFVIAVSFLPFFLAGTFLSYCFKEMASSSGTLFALDMLGAAIGVFAFLNFIKLGGIAVLLISSLIASLVSIILITGKNRRNSQVLVSLVTVAIAVVLFLNLTTGIPGEIDLLPSYHKEMYHVFNHPSYNSEIVATNWSSFGRTDLVRNARNPDEMVFFIDGSAGSAMYRFNGDYTDSTFNRKLLRLREFPGYMAVSLIPPEEKKSALVIGPGGGRDVHVLKLGGVKDVTAVEINGDLIKLGRNYGDYNGGIFSGLDDITFVEDEGRSFLRRSDDLFDIIYLSIPVVKSSRSPGGFALSENYLFTVESFRDYIRHLKKHGRLIIVAHNGLEIYKLAFSGLKALEEEGIIPKEGLKHIYIAGFLTNPLIVIKRSKLERYEAEEIHKALMASDLSFPSSTYIPFVSQHKQVIETQLGISVESPMLIQGFIDIEQGKYSPEEVIKAVEYNLRPPMDDSPFFYNMDKNAPGAIMFMILTSSAILLILFYSGNKGLSRQDKKKRFLFRILFFSLGAGFMLLEIPLIQKYILFLGKPVYSLSVLLVACFSGAGIGSYLSGKVNVNFTRKIIISLASIIALTSFHLIAAPVIFDNYLDKAIAFRIAISAGLIFPLGFFLGIPFPTVIKFLHENKLTQQIPYLWGINSISALFGSVTAIGLAIEIGYRASLIGGMILYVTALFTALIAAKDRRTEVNGSGLLKR